EFAEFAKQIGVGYIARPDNNHAKAGNMNHAMRYTDGEYIAIFDCDHIPARSFLQMTMGQFIKDEKVCLVQTPHHFFSADPFERNLN
ncbi:glycosyltransferase, partial [Salmonella sp. ZJJH19_0126]